MKNLGLHALAVGAFLSFVHDTAWSQTTSDTNGTMQSHSGTIAGSLPTQLPTVETDRSEPGGLVQTRPGTIRGAAPVQAPAVQGPLPLLGAARSAAAVVLTNGIVKTQPGTIRGPVPTQPPTEEEPIPANGLVQTTPGTIRGTIPAQAPVSQAVLRQPDPSVRPPPGSEDIAISAPRFGAIGFSCSIVSQSGRTYALEYKESLEQAQWTALPPVAGNGARLMLVDPHVGPRQRLYRIRQSD